MALRYVDIPLQPDPYYDLSIALEGNSYIVEFAYVERMQLYTISLYDSDKNPIVLGEALVPSYPIFQDYNIENLTGHFLLTKKPVLASEPYKLYPDKIHEYYWLAYVYEV
jgi:hypothetical protein